MHVLGPGITYDNELSCVRMDILSEEQNEKHGYEHQQEFIILHKNLFSCMPLRNPRDLVNRFRSLAGRITILENKRVRRMLLFILPDESPILRIENNSSCTIVIN